MEQLRASVAILVLSGGLVFAEGGAGGGSGGSSGGTSGGTSSTGSASTATTGTNAASQSGAGSSALPGSQVNGPNNTGGPAPGLSTTQPSDNLTVGRAPGVNPANPQDASRRTNPSDRTLPGARNPQDMKAFDTGTPQIIAPERR